jgi:predicted transcriptional regulator
MKRPTPSNPKELRALSGELEGPLMGILWRRGPLTGRELYQDIRREKDIAYTTALTVLDRLSKKGFIRKDKTSGTILFVAGISEEDYRTGVVGGLVRTAFEMSPGLAVSHFADAVSELSPGALDALARLIEEKKREGR